MLNTEILDFDAENQGVPVVIYPTTVALTNLDTTAVIGVKLADDGLLGSIPLIGDLAQDVVNALLGATGLGDFIEATNLDNIGLAPIPTATGPNIMRIRYEPEDPNDPDSPRTVPPVGYIVDTPDGPVFRIQFDLLFDAPALSLPLGLEHNVKSLPIDNIQLEGPLDFLPDGRLFLGLQNQEALDVDLEITLAGLDGGKVLLQIPPGGINLSYQSPSIQ